MCMRKPRGYRLALGEPCFSLGNPLIPCASGNGHSYSTPLFGRIHENGRKSAGKSAKSKCEDRADGLSNAIGA
jgi:hypothetical protein